MEVRINKNSVELLPENVGDEMCLYEYRTSISARVEAEGLTLKLTIKKAGTQ